MNQDRDRQQQFEVCNFCKYYPIGNIPETLLLIEQEYLQRDRYRNIKKNSILTQKIILSLGFIAVLLCVGGIQLNPAVNPQSVKSNNQAEKVFTFDTSENSREIYTKKLERQIT